MLDGEKMSEKDGKRGREDEETRMVTMLSRFLGTMISLPSRRHSYASGTPILAIAEFLDT